MFICPHVHLRDFKEDYKETIAHGLHVAERAGFTAVIDMPNSNPEITDAYVARARLERAKEANSPVRYFMHALLTKDPDQVKRAINAYRTIDEVVGFKLYAGHSVRNLGVVNPSDQEKIYQTLTAEGYDGVLVVHCEKESFMTPTLWDSKNPITHAYARPWQAEVRSLEDQLAFATTYKFPGTLHVAHVSVPETVELLHAQKEVKTTCGVTPHHLLLDYFALEKNGGIIMKMNPPLRPPGMNVQLLQLLRQRKITWVETDHAPHDLYEKLNAPHCSGITSIQKYPKFVRWLSTQGLNEQHIRDITFNNINRTYALELEPRTCTPALDLEKEYPFDPYQPFGLLP